MSGACLCGRKDGLVGLSRKFESGTSITVHTTAGAPLAALTGSPCVLIRDTNFKHFLIFVSEEPVQF